MNNFLRELLLLKTTDIEQIVRIVKGISFPLLSLSFVLGAIYENLGGQNFIGLFKRMIFALFLISFGSSLLKSTVNLSFDISARVINSVQMTNPVVQLMDRARKISQQQRESDRTAGFVEKSKNAAKGIWESQAFVTKLLFDDGISSVIFVFSYTCLMLLGQLFTIVYNFSYVSIPLLAALIVFPPTYSVANSISRTISWVFLMPIFTMITVLLLSSTFSFPQDNSKIYFVPSLESLINFFIMALMLLFVPTVVSGFLSGAGVLTAAETFTKTTVTAALTGGKSLVLNSAKAIGGKVIFGKNFGLATMAKIGVSKGLDRLGHKSIDARDRLSRKDAPSNPPTRPSQSPNEKSFNKTTASSSHVSAAASGNTSSNTNSANAERSSFLSKSVDKSIVATDSVLNFKKNYLASKAVRNDLQQSPQRGATQSHSDLFNKYKLNAHKDARVQRPLDYRISKIRGGDFTKKHDTKTSERKLYGTKFNRDRGGRT